MHNTPRITWIDHAKLFFVLSFAYTSIQRGLFRNGFTEFGYGFHILDSLLQSITLPLCFFVAGYLFQTFKDRQTMDKLHRLMTDKLLYAFVVWTFIQGVVKVLFSGYTGSTSLLIDIYYDLTSEPGNHFWVLIALLVHFCLATLLSGLSSSLSQAAILLCSVLGYLFQDQLPKIYPLSYIPQYWVFFVAGQYHQQSGKRSGDRHSHLPYWIAAVVFVLLQIVIQSQWLTVRHPILGLITSLCGLVAVTGVCRWMGNRNVQLPELVTRAIFPLFLLHAILGNGAREILSNSFGLAGSKLHLLIACTLVCVVPCLLVSRIGFSVSRYLFFSPTLLSPYRALSCAKMTLKKSQRLFSGVLVCGIVLLGGLVILELWSSQLIGKSAVSSTDSSKRNLSLSTDPERISEGARLAQVYGCYIGCHGTKMEGNILYRKPFFGVMAPPNLTRIFDQYSTNELDGIIRHGIWPDQSPVLRGMPSSAFAALSDHDLINILSFIKSYPAQSHTTPVNSLGVMNKIRVLQGNFTTQAAETREAQAFYAKNSPASEYARGRQIARAACGECHNYNLMGRAHLGSPPLLVAHAYNLDQFRHLLHEGIKPDGQGAGLMSVVAKNRFIKLTDAEIAEIFHYLRSDEFALSAADH